MDKFKIGREKNGKVVHAFTMRRRGDGGLSFTEIQSMTDAEQTLLLQHFGYAHDTILGIAGEQHVRPTTPGTETQFYAALSKMPAPFYIMAEK